MAQGRRLFVAKPDLGLHQIAPIEEEQRNPSSNPTAAHQQHKPEEDYIFNERDLNHYWQEYAGRMPHESRRAVKRMQKYASLLINDTTFEAVVVDNEIVANEFTA